jgi:hypothetical protein
MGSLENLTRAIQPVSLLSSANRGGCIFPGGWVKIGEFGNLKGA